MACAVHLNLDGLLTEHDIDYEAVYAQALDAADLDLADEHGTYTDAFFEYFQNNWTYPRRQAILTIMRNNDLEDLGHSDTFATAWEDAEHDQTTFRPDAQDTVAALADGYDVGIVTNGTGRLQRMKLDTAGITDHLSALVISSEIGVTKPHSDIFETAQGAIDAETHVIVSQDLRRDIIPAKRAGFTTVWVSPQDADDRIDEVVDRQVASLADVPDAVDALCN